MSKKVTDKEGWNQNVESENVVKNFMPSLVSSQEPLKFSWEHLGDYWPQVQKTNNMCIHFTSVAPLSGLRKLG